MRRIISYMSFSKNIVVIGVTNFYDIRFTGYVRSRRRALISVFLSLSTRKFYHIRTVSS